MNLWRTLFGAKAAVAPEADATPAIPGDRGTASVQQARSIQSRLNNVMAVGLIGTLGVGLLFWYYSEAWAHQKSAKEEAHKTVKDRAQGDMVLPPLGKLESPGAQGTRTASEPMSATPKAMELPAQSASGSAYAERVGAPVAGDRPGDRRLEGPVFQALGVAAESSGSSRLMYPVSSQTEASPAIGSDGNLESLLSTRAAPAVRALVLPSQPLVLPKGAFIDCTLETAIDSTLPGLTTCITATDTFGSDGKVVLLERGSKLVGETKGDVRQGTARLFVLWTEARTPAGVVVPLASPGTDELGRSGMPGAVDRHFMDRFGAALLISIVEGAVQAAAQSKSAGAVIYNPAAASNVVTEVLKSTINIPPTVRKQNGDRIQILVARDVDFRSVYALHAHE